MVCLIKNEDLTEKWTPLKSASRQGNIISCCAQSTRLLGHDPASQGIRNISQNLNVSILRQASSLEFIALLVISYLLFDPFAETNN